MTVEVAGQFSNGKRRLECPEGFVADARTGLCEVASAAQSPSNDGLAIVVGCVLGALLLLAVAYARRMRRASSRLASENAAMAADAREGWVIDPSLLHVDRERRLGRGGFGDVFAAKYLGSDVACKIVRPDASASDAADGFVDEVSVLTKLHHPNILMILGVVRRESHATSEREFWVVTELMERGSLKDIVAAT